MSAENRAAVLVALGGGGPVAPGPSPPRKATLFGAGPADAVPPLPPLPYTPLFPDADMLEAPGNADLARVENDLLALVRSSGSGLPSVRDKAAFDENAPLNVAAFEGMLGPCELDADAQTLPDLATLVASQTADLITACREIIPKVARQLNLVFKPQRRLELLLRTFGWVFVARSREPVGVVALSICIARKAAGLAHTHSVDSDTCSPCDHSSFASAVLMLMHGFLDAFPRFEFAQGNG